MTAVHTSKALDELADQYLQAVIDGTDPGFEPEESAEWAEAFLKSIGRFREVGNFRHSREAERAAERFGRQTSADTYRFFWEFWQNADDAGASEVVFTVDDDCLVITNNGKPFNSREIYSLIFVASTTKSARPDLIGQFGIGSLSLMRFTKTPTYLSGNYAFKLERSFTYPEPVEEADRGFYSGTRVIAPLNPDVDRDQIFNDLAEMVESETLLYMKSLGRVTVRDQRSGEAKVAVIDVRRRGDGDVIKLGHREWLRFARMVVPPPGIRRDDGTEVNEPLTITLVRERDEKGPHPVCAYFPTQQYHSYPWRFSAPFDVTTGRENLVRSDFNRWLLRETGRTMLHAAIAKGVGSRSEPWHLVPLEGHEDSLLDEVWHGARAEMKVTAWLPTRAGPVKPAEAVFAETTEVRSLVGMTDLMDLFEGRRNWVRGIPTAIARPVLRDLGAMRVCCHTLSRILAKGPPNRKPDWYLKALSSAIQMYREIGGDETEEIEARLIGGRCVLERGSRKKRGQPTSLAKVGQSGRVVCNTRSEVPATELGRLFPDSLVTALHRVYRLPDRTTDDPTDDLRRKVDEWFRQVSSSATFRYANRFDTSAFIRMFVVEGQRPDHPENVSDDILSFVRDHLESYASDYEPNRRDETLRQLGRSVLVKSHTVDACGKSITEYKPISEVHIPAGYPGRPTWSRAARGVPGLWWAHWRYRNTLVRSESQMSVIEFLRVLGAHFGPRIEPIAANASHNVHRFTKVTRGDSVRFPNFPHGSVAFDEYTDYGLVGDSESPDLAAWLRYVANLSPAERSARGEALLRTFEEQWQTYADRSTAKARGYYSNGEFLHRQRAIQVGLGTKAVGLGCRVPGVRAASEYIREDGRISSRP